MAEAAQTSRPALPQIELLEVGATAGPVELAQVRELVSEYAGSLSIDLCFQNFEAELNQLPGEYAPPLGALLLALVDGAAAGCVAMRPLPDADHSNACEMKRLFVRPAFRRLGLGRLLTQRLIDEAGGAGYSCMLLDTLDEMASARDLYGTLGFYEIPPYYFNPIAGAHYLKVMLDGSGVRR